METKYDLEERTFKFARDIRHFLKQIDSAVLNNEDKKQLIRSSGSVAANYIEANEAVSKKDFVLRIRICKKESKESFLWLRFIEESNPIISKEKGRLISESIQLGKIFGSIIQKVGIQ